MAGFDYMKMPPSLEVVMFGGAESDALFPTFIFNDVWGTFIPNPDENKMIR